MRQLFGRLLYRLCVKLAFLSACFLNRREDGVMLGIHAGYYFNKAYSSDPRVRIDWTDAEGIMMQTYIMRPQEAEVLVSEITDVLGAIKSEGQ